MSLLVLCPTKGRPAAAAATYASFLGTRSRSVDTHILFIIGDDEDPILYNGLPLLVVPHRTWMNEVLAEAVDLILRYDLPDILGFVGDDNRFVTVGWDTKVSAVLADGGFAYCNDHLRPDLPTHVFVTTNIVKRLGWFGLPGLWHLYLDNVWRVLGTKTGSLHYLPYVILQHLNPLTGMGQMDDIFRASNAPAVYEHDQAVFAEWVATRAEGDIETVRDVLRG